MHALLWSLQHSLFHRASVSFCPPTILAGFCTSTSVLPLPENQQTLETEIASATVSLNGMNVTFGETVHCVAAEPDATFLRLSVLDRGQEVAYETAVLARLQSGYRIFQMRSLGGTRIELCYVLVRIRLGSEPNLFLSPKQARS